MSAALNTTRSGGYGFIHYDIDNWGNEQVTKWGPGIADSWTTSVPIGASNKPANAFAQMRHSFFKNIQSATAQGTGHFNSPGELLVGRNLLTDDEEKTQFALGAVSKSPLIFTANMTSMPFTSEAILKNAALIEVNQNQVGRQAQCTQGCDYSDSNSTQSFQTTIQTDTEAYVVVVAVNWDDATPAADYTYDLVSNNIAFSKYDSCTTTDLWTGETSTHNGAP